MFGLYHTNHPYQTLYHPFYHPWDFLLRVYLFFPLSDFLLEVFRNYLTILIMLVRIRYTPLEIKEPGLIIKLTSRRIHSSSIIINDAVSHRNILIQARIWK